MALTKIPLVEIQALNRIILEKFYHQYHKTIDTDTVSPSFIPPRVNTRIGYEIVTILSGVYLKIRIYARAFVKSPLIDPFRMEDIQNQENGPGIQVFVLITDLPIDLFPVLSRTDDPTYDPSAGPYAIELEDLSGYIQAETGDYLTLETEP